MSTNEDQQVFHDRRRQFYDALRSGRFQQGTGTLSRRIADNQWEHCCLGVACVVASENGLHVPHHDVAGGETRYYLANAYRTEDDVDLEDEEDAFTNSEDLPLAVKEWYGFRSHDPELEVSLRDEDGLYYVADIPASTLNDDKGYNFAQIADAFEATYPCTHEPEEPHGVLEP